MSLHTAELKREIKQLRQVCSEAYQAVGMLAGLVPDKQLHKALDNLACAARGDPLPHKTFLPLTIRTSRLAERLAEKEARK